MPTVPPRSVKRRQRERQPRGGLLFRRDPHILLLYYLVKLSRVFDSQALRGNEIDSEMAPQAVEKARLGLGNGSLLRLVDGCMRAETASTIR